MDYPGKHPCEKVVLYHHKYGENQAPNDDYTRQPTENIARLSWNICCPCGQSKTQKGDRLSHSATRGEGGRVACIEPVPACAAPTATRLSNRALGPIFVPPMALPKRSIRTAIAGYQKPAMARTMATVSK